MRSRDPKSDNPLIPENRLFRSRKAIPALMDRVILELYFEMVYREGSLTPRLTFAKQSSEAITPFPPLSSPITRNALQFDTRCLIRWWRPVAIISARVRIADLRRKSGRPSVVDRCARNEPATISDLRRWKRPLAKTI